MCDYYDAYTVVKVIIIVEGIKDANKRNKNTEDVDIIILVYNLLEFSDNYSITSGSLRSY